MGRNVSEKTQEIRFTQVLGIVNKAEKVMDLVREGANDAKNRVEAFERRKSAKMALYASFGLAEEQIKGLMAADGLDDENAIKADQGRVEAADKVIGALETLAKNAGVLKHYLTSKAGIELVNDLF